MIKTILALLLLTGSVVVAEARVGSSASRNLPILRLYDPLGHVSRWIGVIWTGAVNHPIIPVYYSIERGVRPASSMARFVLLSRAEYARLSDFIHYRPCSHDNVAKRSPFPDTIAVDELLPGKRLPSCYMTRDPACDFLARLMGVPGIDWARKDNYPLNQFQREFECKGTETAPR